MQWSYELWNIFTGSLNCLGWYGECSLKSSAQSLAYYVGVGGGLRFKRARGSRENH